MDGLSLNFCLDAQTLGEAPMHFKRPTWPSHLTSQRYLKFSEKGIRWLIPTENHGRLPAAVQKISNIFG
jgi:hypothetical protein